jgi:ribonuclease HI
MLIKGNKVSKYIGNATNNQAELEAIRLGLSEINKKPLLHVRGFLF